MIWELSGDEIYRRLKEHVMKQKQRKGNWRMCEMARELERIGKEQGIQTGIFAMIRDNLDMGKGKEDILEKLVKYFSITKDSAKNYYEQVMVG